MHLVTHYYKIGNKQQQQQQQKQHDDDDDDDCFEEVQQWIRISDEVVQIGSRFVWALVRGFAWWPAQVLICEETNDGYVFVVFFGSEQVATIKDTPELIRPFSIRH